MLSNQISSSSRALRHAVVRSYQCADNMKVCQAEGIQGPLDQSVGALVRGRLSQHTTAIARSIKT